MSQPFTDAQLRAFLDGDIEDEALLDQIEAAINADSALAAVGAMVASLVLGILIGGPILTGGDRDAASDGALVLAAAEGPVPPSAGSAMLDTVPSGQAVDLARLGTGEVVLIFRNADGALCRLFMISTAIRKRSSRNCTTSGLPARAPQNHDAGRRSAHDRHGRADGARRPDQR
jgi:hypothetical protein